MEPWPMSPHCRTRLGKEKGDPPSEEELEEAADAGPGHLQRIRHRHLLQLHNKTVGGEVSDTKRAKARQGYSQRFQSLLRPQAYARQHVPQDGSRWEPLWTLARVGAE